MELKARGLRMPGGPWKSFSKTVTCPRSRNGVENVKCMRFFFPFDGEGDP